MEGENRHESTEIEGFAQEAAAATQSAFFAPSDYTGKGFAGTRTIDRQAPSDQPERADPRNIAEQSAHLRRCDQDQGSGQADKPLRSDGE